MSNQTESARNRRPPSYVSLLLTGLTVIWSIAVFVAFSATSRGAWFADLHSGWYALLWFVGVASLVLVLRRRWTAGDQIHSAATDLTPPGKPDRQQLWQVAVMDAVQTPITVIRHDFRIIMMNRASRLEYGNSNDAGEDKPLCYKMLHHQDKPCSGIDHPCPLRRAEQTGKTVRVIHRHLNRNEEVAYVEIEASPIFAIDGQFKGIVENERDVTAQVLKDMEQRGKVVQLIRRVQHDSLTKLPNRLLLNDRISQAILRADRSSKNLAVLFLDLDNFKQINDHHGHAKGDELLILVAERINRCVRKSDTVARYAGDEFVVVLDQVGSRSSPAAVARKTLEILSELVHVQNSSFYVTASIGVSMYPGDAWDAESLLSNADSAMYRAKREGGNRVKYFHELRGEKEQIVTLAANDTFNAKQ